MLTAVDLTFRFLLANVLGLVPPLFSLRFNLSVLKVICLYFLILPVKDLGFLSIAESTISLQGYFIIVCNNACRYSLNKTNIPTLYPRINNIIPKIVISSLVILLDNV